MENNYFTPFLKTVGESIKQFADSVMGNPHEHIDRYQSRWGDIHDGFLNESHDGLRFGSYALSEDDSMRHGLCIAPSGTGKTSTTVINTALSAVGQSFIIHSEALDVYEKTSGFFKQKGYEVYLLDLSNKDASNHWNPLPNIPKEDIPKVSQVIVGTNDKMDSFWQDSSISFISCLLLTVKNMDAEYQTFSYVKKLLNWLGSAPEKVDEIVARYADSETLENYKYITSITEKTYSSILASCQASMRIFDDVHVTEIMSKNEIPLDIRSRRVVVFLKNNLQNSTYVSMVLGMYLHLTMGELMKNPLVGSKVRPVYVLLDESTMLHRSFSELGLYLSQIRKYRISMLVIAQNINLLKRFTDFETILANAMTKIFFNSLDVTSSQYVSDAIGKTTVIDKQGNDRIVPLITGEQVRQLGHNEVIILSGARHAYRIRLKSYYTQFILNMRSKIPPVNILAERKKSLN